MILSLIFKSGRDFPQYGLTASSFKLISLPTSCILLLLSLGELQCSQAYVNFPHEACMHGCVCVCVSFKGIWKLLLAFSQWRMFCERAEGLVSKELSDQELRRWQTCTVERVLTPGGTGFRTSPVGVENKAGSVFSNAGSISLLQNTLMNILTLMDMHLFQCDLCHGNDCFSFKIKLFT